MMQLLLPPREQKLFRDLVFSLCPLDYGIQQNTFWEKTRTVLYETFALLSVMYPVKVNGWEEATGSSIT